MRWSPDTCNCILDCSLDQDGVNLDWIATVNTCSLHLDLIGQALLDQVLKENRAKNMEELS